MERSDFKISVLTMCVILAVVLFWDIITLLDRLALGR